eukprot:3977615-Ditylum_brightwellii.AAC.1
MPSCHVEDVCADLCHDLGLSHRLEQIRSEHAHPSVGGSAGYEYYYCLMLLEFWDQGYPVGCSMASIY